MSTFYKVLRTYSSIFKKSVLSTYSSTLKNASTQYLPSFKIIGLLVLEKKIFKGFVICSHGGHLGHETLTIYINFSSPFLRILHMKFGFAWPSAFRVEIFAIQNDGRATTTDAVAWLR